MSLAIGSVLSGRFGISRTVILIAVLSLAVHLVLTAFFSHTYDSEYWLIIIQNVENGNGLYGLNGFYYTPVWGYLLSFADMLTQVAGVAPILGDKFTDLIMIEDFEGYQAILASPGINFLLKLPLSICDIVVGYLLYVIVRRYTGSERRGHQAMALWCFCPIVVYMSAIQGQFDTISVFLLLVTLFLIKDDKFLLAGFMFALATWLKIFPGVCILVLLAYVIARKKGTCDIRKSVIMSVVGFGAMTLMIFLPQILNGELALAFSFFTSRASGYDASTSFNLIFMLAVIVLLMLLMVRAMLRKDSEDADMQVFLYCGMLASIATMVQWGYQYAPSVVGFIILFMMLSPNRHGYLTIYLLVSIFTFMEALFWVNYSALFIASEYFGIADPSWVVWETISFALDWGSESLTGLMGDFDRVWHWAMYAFVILGAVDLCRGWSDRLDRASDYIRSFGGRLG